LHLELNNLILVVTVGVALCQDAESLLRLATRDEETRGLINNPHEDELKDGRESLDEGRHTPRPLGLDVEGTECEPCGNNGSDVPEGVVDGSEGSTVLGVGQLGNEHGRTTLGDRDTETNDESETWSAIVMLTKIE